VRSVHLTHLTLVRKSGTRTQPSYHTMYLTKPDITPNPQDAPDAAPSTQDALDAAPSTQDAPDAAPSTQDALDAAPNTQDAICSFRYKASRAPKPAGPRLNSPPRPGQWPRAGRCCFQPLPLAPSRPLPHSMPRTAPRQ